MQFARTGISLALLALCAAVQSPAHAQQGDEYASQVVRCQSRDLEWVHCEMDVSQGVDMVRQISGNACVRGSEWGTDRSGVWVTLGCRAEFRARAPRNAEAGTTPTARQVRRVVRCESRGRPESCPVKLDGAPVRLLRQNSSLPCREGRSWGYRRNEIWTTRGCQADFEVGAEDGSGFIDVPRRITCESKDRRRRFCGASISVRATLIKQISGRSCDEGRSWGWERNGVWVDDGCRAEFSVN